MKFLSFSAGLSAFLLGKLVLHFLSFGLVRCATCLRLEHSMSAQNNLCTCIQYVRVIYIDHVILGLHSIDMHHANAFRGLGVSPCSGDTESLFCVSHGSGITIITVLCISRSGPVPCDSLA